jgi:long-subunit fatty acid transport protein
LIRPLPKQVAAKVVMQEFSPSIAYKINSRLSIGAGVSAVYSVLDEEIAICQPAFS